MSSSRALVKGVIRELDGLRGIAILLVMVHRFWPRTGVGMAADVAGAGWIGVDLFFVISGFLIAGILLDTRGEPGYFRNFYARRMLRIFPLYYLFVIGVFVAFAGNASFREHSGSPLWYLLHLGNVPEGVLGNDVPYWLAPTWSLAIEEQFYLTFPLLVFALDRRRLTYVLIGMIVLAPALRMATTFAFPDHERVQYLFTLCRVDTLAIGCLLAVIVRATDFDRHRTRVLQLAALAVPGVVVLGVASGLERTSPFDRVFGYSLVAVGCASVLAIVMLSRGTRATAPLRWGPLTYLGKLCFGLYLLHRPADTLVSAAAARVGLEGDLWLMPAKIAVAIALATLSWRLLERPFMQLKDRFASANHPSAQTAAAPEGWLPRALRMIGLLIVIGVLACRGDSPAARDGAIDRDAGELDAADAMLADARDAAFDTPVPIDAPPDAPPPPPPGVVLYPEGARHSPITPALVAHLQALAGAHDGHAFAKVGDSITVDTDFLHCFAGGYDLGTHGELAPAIAQFAGAFARTSLAAKGGTTARDALAGSRCPLERELAAIDPQLAVVMFGTNEIRYDWSYDEAASHLWALVDRTLAAGVIPILSTIPANVGYPAADARIPGYNRLIRALAQGRQIPLVDLHAALAPLPNHGISGDGLHPSVSPDGGCMLTAAGLQHGYNMRNLVTLEALSRVHAALAGTASDASAPTRTGTGALSDPYAVAVPFVDLGDTQAGAPITHPCGSGRARVYRATLASAMTLQAFVVDRAGVDVAVHVIANGACIASGEASVAATVGPGVVDIVIDAHVDGEYLLAVQPS